MSKPIASYGPGKVAADARVFAIASIVIAVAVLLIFIGINGGLKDQPEKGATAAGMSAPVAQPT